MGVWDQNNKYRWFIVWKCTTLWFMLYGLHCGVGGAKQVMWP